MDVDAAILWHFQYFPGKNLPKRSYYKQLGIIRAKMRNALGVFDPPRLVYADAKLHRGGLYRGKLHRFSPAFRLIRLCHRQYNLMPCFF